MGLCAVISVVLLVVLLLFAVKWLFFGKSEGFDARSPFIAKKLTKRKRMPPFAKVREWVDAVEYHLLRKADHQLSKQGKPMTAQEIDKVLTDAS